MKHYHIQFNTHDEGIIQKINGISFIFVLSGSLNCMVNNVNHDLQTGELLLLNHRDVVLINHFDGDYMSFNINQQFIDRVIDDFPTFKLHAMNNNIEMIKNILSKIGIVYLRKSKYFKLFIEQQAMELLMILIKYVPQVKSTDHLEHSEDLRLERVCKYIDRHYEEPITLNDMAEYVHLSPAYLSKLFNKKMNIGFNQFLNEVRLEHVMLDLVYTDHSMIDIALENGFSSSALLSRAFKKWTGTSPSQYREQHQTKLTKTHSIDISEREIIQQLSHYIINDNRQLMHSPESGKNIEITLSENAHKINQFKHIIQIGDLDALLNEQVQQQLLTCKNEIGLTHVLVKDPIESPYLISAEISTDEQLANYQRYNNVDACLDYLINNNIDIIITIHPKHSLEEYLLQLDDFFKHITMRLEINHDINLKLYMKHIELNHYKRIIKTIMKYIPNIRLIVHLDLDYLGDTVNIIKFNPEIIEQVAFDANQNDLVNFDITEDGLFENTKHHIVDKANEVIQLLDAHNIEIPLILLNWNTLTGDTHLTNGEYFRGGIIFEQFLQLNKMIDTIGYWLNYDLHINHAINEKEYMNSIELFHQYNGKRPAFFTSQLYRKLFTEVLYSNDNCIVVGKPNHFQIVVYDAEHFNPYLSLNASLPFLENKEVEIIIKALNQGTYRIKHYTLDKNHGALYQNWQSYNTRSGIDAESIAYINRISFPKLKISEQVVNQDFQYNLILLTNAIHIIDVKQYIE